MRILIAEDERITRLTLSRQLAGWGHEVTVAEDGHDAWERFAAGEFDIVITDWEMPRVSGVELVQRIRAAPRAVYTYVIILTSRQEKADIVSGIEAGADDFVSKPFDRDELRVRLLAGERILTLERALNKQNTELRDMNERIRGALQAAARVQQSMLPKQNVVTPHVRTAWRYVPTDELAGDAIGLFLIDDRYLVAYVLDVSGHGVPAALLSVTAMHALEPDPAETSLLRSLSVSKNEASSATRENPLPPPVIRGRAGVGVAGGASAGAGNDHRFGTVQRAARVATDLNRRFRAGENDGRFLTMVLCVLDTHDGRLQITCAGHPPPLLLRGGEASMLPGAGGFPIAVFDGADYEDAVVQLQPGDRVCLFSDGIPEQDGGPAKDPFDVTRLQQSLAGRNAILADQAVNGVIEDLATWAGSQAFADDVSIVLIDWPGAR